MVSVTENDEGFFHIFGHFRPCHSGGFGLLAILIIPTALGISEDDGNNESDDDGEGVSEGLGVDERG